MAEVLVEFAELVSDEKGVRYHAHACGTELPDGKWHGWVEFMPVDGAPPIRSGRETTQPNRKDTMYWATGLSAVYLEGALQRALSSYCKARTPEEALFAGPAPTRATDRAPNSEHDAVIDPFSVYEKGEARLRSQLMALAPWHLVNIIDAYGLSDASLVVLNRLPAATLIDTIVSAVAQERNRK